MHWLHENLMLEIQVLCVKQPTVFVCFLIYYGVLRNSSSLNTKCFFPLKDCRTDTMCITNSAAGGRMFCLPLHGNAGNFSGFFWEGAEFNLHFVTYFHPIPTAVVSVNTGTPILLKEKKRYWENVLVKCSSFPFFCKWWQGIHLCFFSQHLGAFPSYPMV